MASDRETPSAFPHDRVDLSPVVDALPPSPGMSLRDWFAGQALAGLASVDAYESVPKNAYERDGGATYKAETAYQYADAMLKARQASPENGSSQQTGEQSDG